MRAEIIAVGTEILLGQIVDTNSQYISQKLATLGIDVYHRVTVGDNPMRLTEALNEALLRSDIVFTIGGLGPTVDDVTLYAVASATSRALIFEKKIERELVCYFRKRGAKKVPKDALRQAYIPRGGKWFKNEVGTAPSILIEHAGKFVIALPGPPRELIPTMEKYIIPYLKKIGAAGNWTIKTKTLKISALPEVKVNEIVKDLLSIGPGTTVGIYAHLGEVHLKVSSKSKNEKIADKNISKIEKAIRKRLGTYVYGADDETLESVVGASISKQKKTLAIAESCTGGLITNRITNISGSSKYFRLGVVAYSDKAKIELLDVPPEDLKKYGAVSKEVALDMAKGVLRCANADFALGVTGIAGPTGGTKTKPVGLVFIAVVSNKMKIVKKCLFHGTREEIKLQTSTEALNLLRAATA